MPPSEAAGLLRRIRELGLDRQLRAATVRDTAGGPYPLAQGDRSDSAAYWQRQWMELKSRGAYERALRRSRIFGAELFGDRNLTFEPDLRMLPPADYRIGPDDELLIDVYGYAEAQHRLTVSPEGHVRIPYLGPVQVSGLTLDEARVRVSERLAAIHPSIRSSDSQVQVSMGRMRSIRVMLIGDVVSPGSYTLPGVATVANALYASGGPGEQGSFRDIQVVRGGKTIATFDLYDFLVRGSLAGNVILRDQDIIKVNSCQYRVELLGEVRRPAIFEARPGETLQQLLEYAGGLTEKAYRRVIRADRAGDERRELVNVGADEVGRFLVRAGDRFFIDSILDDYANRVSIAGAVSHPGHYALETGMTVASLIDRAAGLTEGAFLSRGTIRRLQADRTPAVIDFNVADALSGRHDLALQREDSVVVYAVDALHEPYGVEIRGEVNRPGRYGYADSMQVEDLVLMAGGLRDAASLQRVEIARRVRSGDTVDARRAVIHRFDLSGGAPLPDSAQFVLQPFDEVTVRRAPGYTDQAYVEIGGEVRYPGRYAINTDEERISDILRRAGGLRPEAYSEGAVLMRRTFVNESDSALLTNRLELFYNQLRDSADAGHLVRAMRRKEQLLDVDLLSIIRRPGSDDDLLLEEGDLLRVPKRLQTVQVFGEIYFPKKIRFARDMGFRDYIDGAGGFTGEALRRRSYIVYANGEVRNTKKFLFFNSYPEVKPGAEIYVPTRSSPRRLNGQQAIGLASGLASLALIITTLLNTLN
ncbi:SLBB domain-containing protein [Parapedobacter sp. DT-150]|uniref:SLBB domain-containing protein n=1 Tax=Parapedobacter sp. DT-150 TaxID=3396162 RepID=UPI003F1DE577